MWRLLLLVLGSCVLGQRMEMSSECLTRQKNPKTITYRNCQTELVAGRGGLQVRCHVVSTAVADNVHLMFTAVFNTSGDIVSQQSDRVTQCLRLVSGQVKTINHRDVDPSHTLLNLPLQSLGISLNLKYLEMNATMLSDDSVGWITYIPSCLEDVKKRANENTFSRGVNISGCVDFVELSEMAASPTNSSITDKLMNSNLLMILQKDVLSVFLEVIDKIWMNNFKYTVSSVKFISGDENVRFPLDAMTFLAGRNVETVALPTNKFSTIKKNDFPHMPTLKTLDMSECSLTSIDDSSFNQISNLNYLNLAGNHLKGIPQAVSGLVSLEGLNMSANTYDDVQARFESPPNILNNLFRLRILDLSRLNLASHEPNMHDTIRLDSLQVLDLSQTTPNNFLGQLTTPNLKVLRLSKLNLTNEDIQKDILGQTEQSQRRELEVLDLSGNLLSHGYDYSALFNRFPQLKQVSLAGNNITQFQPITFASDSRGSYFLNLSDNRIETWTSPALKQYQQKIRLDVDLSNNSIVEVSPAMLEDFSKLNRLYLGNNMFDCKAKTYEPFQKWLAQNRTATDYKEAIYRCGGISKNGGSNLQENVFAWFILFQCVLIYLH